MAGKVGVVTGYIPLPVKHLTQDQYYTLGNRLEAAVKSAGAKWVICSGAFNSCWAARLCVGLPPANPPPADRYDTPEINVMSHIVQHQRTTWAKEAQEAHPDVNTWVWFDYGLLKQGYWNGKPVAEDAVERFLHRVAEASPLDDIPFPGITEKGPVYAIGNNWRFCGSTHIWPAKYLPDIDRIYKVELEAWVKKHKTVPLDLPIWALVEQTYPLMPFRWYQGEYDVTQLDNFNPAV